MTSFLKSNDSLLCLSSCLRSARSSIQSTAEFRSVVSHMHSSSAATAKSFVLSRWPIADVGRGIGNRAYKIANKLLHATRKPARVSNGVRRKGD